MPSSVGHEREAVGLASLVVVVAIADVAGVDEGQEAAQVVEGVLC